MPEILTFFNTTAAAESLKATITDTHDVIYGGGSRLETQRGSTLEVFPLAVRITDSDGDMSIKLRRKKLASYIGSDWVGFNRQDKGRSRFAALRESGEIVAQSIVLNPADHTDERQPSKGLPFRNPEQHSLETAIQEDSTTALLIPVRTKELTGTAVIWNGTPESLMTIIALTGEHFVGVDMGNAEGAWRCPGPTCLYQRDRFTTGHGALMLENHGRLVHLPLGWPVVEFENGERIVYGPNAWNTQIKKLNN